MDKTLVERVASAEIARQVRHVAFNVTDLTQRDICNRAADEIDRIAELEAQLARAESLISPMAGDTERLLEMGELRKQLAEQTRLAEGFQGSRDYAIDLLAKALGLETDKGLEYYARLASEQVSLAEERQREVERLLEVLQWYADQQNGKHARAAIEAHKET